MSLLREIARKSGSMGVFSIVSTGIGLISFFIVANLLGPMYYGLLAICMSIYELFSIPHNALNNGLVKFIAENKQIKYFREVIKINTLLAVGFAIVLFVGAETIAGIIHHDIGSLLRLTSIFLFVAVIKETISNAILGSSSVRWYTINEMFFILIRLGLIIVILSKIPDTFGALAAYIIAGIIACAIGFSIIKRKIKWNKEEIKTKELMRYSKKFAYTLLLANTQPQIYLLVLAFFASSSEVGHYKFLLGIITLATVSLISMMSNVLLNYYAALYYQKRMKDIKRIFNVSLRLGCYLLIGIGIGLIIFLNPIITYFFPKFIEVVHLIPLFVLFGVVNGMNFLITPLIKATNKLEIQLKILPISLLVAVGASLILIPRFQITGAIIAAIASTLVTLIGSARKITKELQIDLNIKPEKNDLLLVKKIFERTKVKQVNQAE